MLTQEHQFLFTALVGSRNYGIDIAGSDYDKHLYFLPTLPELISGKEFEKRQIESFEDVHLELVMKDIRKLTKGLKKPNLNSLEVLFSKEFTDLTNDDRMAPLLLRREEFARSDTERLYRSLRGMANDFRRETLRAKDYVYSMDTGLSSNFYKNAARHIFVSKLLLHYGKTNFSSFEKSFRMDSGSLDPIIKVREQGFDPKIILTSMEELERSTAEMESVYCDDDFVDHKLYLWLDDFLEQLILDNLKDPIS